MDRKKILNFALVFPFTMLGLKSFAKAQSKPSVYHFNDDGKIPNSKFPLLVYRNAIPQTTKHPSIWLIEKFEANNWTNSWRNGIYSFHHYHSTAHEVLGIYRGSASVHLGGEKGKIVKVVAGDIFVIPAGVGHKNVESDDLGVVGAYFNGNDWDLKKGLKGERPEADNNLRNLVVPTSDPYLGNTSGLTKLWV